MHRRDLLRLALCTGLVSVVGCERPRTRKDVMEDLVQRVLIPDTRDIVASSAALAVSIRALGAGEDAKALAAARAQFRTTLLAFQRAYALRKGPIVDTNALLRTTFFPTRTGAIDELLAGEAPIDAAAVDELGIDQRGLFAIEALLFGDTGKASPARRSAFLTSLADNVSTYATKVSRALGNGKALAATWSADAQLTLSQIVNDMLASVETLASERVAIVLDMAKRERMLVRNVQGAPSGTSSAIIVAWLEGLAGLYGSGSKGIGALVVGAAPEIDTRLRTLLADALGSAKGLTEPIELVAQREPARVETLLRALKALELAIKVDLTSALGITLTFTSSDGD